MAPGRVSSVPAEGRGIEEDAFSCYPGLGRLLCTGLSGESGLWELPRQGTGCTACSAPELLMRSLRWGTLHRGLPYLE